MHYIGKLKLDKMPAPRRPRPPRLRGQGVLGHWYLQENEDDYPLVTESSFSFDATEGDDKDGEVGKFPPTVDGGAHRLFRYVQNQAGWLSLFRLTKTAYLFEVLREVCCPVGTLREFAQQGQNPRGFR